MTHRTVDFDLAALMRQHKVTIRELAVRMGITMQRVRAIRAETQVSYPLMCDFSEAVTGQKVFDRARYDDMCMW